MEAFDETSSAPHLTHHQLPSMPIEVDPIIAADSDQLSEDEVSEQELRELYDNYEMERYLTLFSAYVSEVRVPEAIRQTSAKGDANVTSESSNPLDSRSLVEDAVSRWLVPLLPPAKPLPHVFTIGKLRLTVQRLYLALEPVYIPFCRRMWDLATWNDRKTSFTYCAIFWILWYHNLLLPSLTLRILYSLVRRRIMPYPTLAELREHQREISRAAAFGDQVSDRISASSPFGFREMRRLFKAAKYVNKDKTSENVTDETAKEPSPIQDDDATVLEDPEINQAIRDSKHLILDALDEMADFHERVKKLAQ